MTRVRLTLGAHNVERIISALRSSKGDRPASREDTILANELQVDLDDAREQERRQAEVDASIAALRAERADKAVLTKRQAESLAAVRDGRGANCTLYRYSDGTTVWRRGRHTGGAIRRMIEALIEEGLLTERRELTDGGRRRLEAWEQKHGHVGETKR